MHSLKTKFIRGELLRSILEHAAEAGVEAVGRGLIKEITQKEIAHGVRTVNAAGWRVSTAGPGGWPGTK